MNERLPIRTILLVDDDPDDRARIRRMLRDQRRRYDVTDCTTAADTIAILHDESRSFDCVLLDYHLPDGDGLSTLAALRGPSGVIAAVTMLTGNDDDENAAQSLAAGAEDYLLKDALTPDALGRSIENVIERFDIRRTLETQRAAIELKNKRLELARDELQVKVTELAAATHARDRFMAMMSHEMRTPLNAILGYAELLELEIDGPLSHAQGRHLERIRLGSRHLLELINDVLDLARADADKLELDVRPVDVRAVLDEVQALLENQARQKHLTLRLEQPPNDLPLAMADLQRLRQIVMNLVGNAIKFTERGTISVKADATPDRSSIRIQVIDTGIGISPDALPLVFKEFFQSDSALTRPYGGSGLGLAISRRLAHVMGSEIEVSSDLGEGSTFTLTLPAAGPESLRRAEDVMRHDNRMATQAAEAATKLRADATVTVAAFGDDAGALSLLASHVQPSVRLLWTVTESELLEIARREQASLVILDVSARNGAAWRVAHSLSELPPDRAPAILILPAIAATPSDSGSPGLDLGWVALVPKPFTANQLTRAVSTAAGRALSADDARQPEPVIEVLVIDDDEDSRRVANRFLVERGIQVRQSADGESGLAEMRRRPPDVVVLDLMMPVLDGFGVLATMRADPMLAGIPVVVLTAKSLTEAERQFLARTAARVLQKGEHRLADVAALVLRAATRAQPPK